MVFGDFAARPPEVISGQIYSGPGAESLLAAAAAWEGLAGELHSAASTYGSVISGLISEPWEGPSSASMAAAAAPYVTWISTTAAQAEDAASQARAAASAYEAALAATLPPAVIAANRSELASLVATNIFGQNGAAIAATEAQYGQMWAQDVAAMFGYASSSAAASQLTPFTDPPTTTNGTAEATQSAAVAAATTSVSPWLQSIEKQITSLTTAYTNFWEVLISGVTGSSKVAPVWEALYSSISNVGSQATWTNVVNSTTSLGISQWKNFFIYQPWSAATPKSSLGAGLASPGHVAPVGPARAASAILGNAPTVGALSVPPSWASATPAIRLVSTVQPGTGVAAAPAANFPVGLLNEGTLGSFTGGALGSPAARVVSSTGIQARAITGERRIGPIKLDRVIAQLQEQPDNVQHWSVDEAGLDDLVARLRTTPGVHAVHVRDDQETTFTRPESQLG